MELAGIQDAVAPPAPSFPAKGNRPRPRADRQAMPDDVVLWQLLRLQAMPLDDDAAPSQRHTARQDGAGRGGGKRRAAGDVDQPDVAGAWIMAVCCRAAHSRMIVGLFRRRHQGVRRETTGDEHYRTAQRSCRPAAFTTVRRLAWPSHLRRGPMRVGETPRRGQSRSSRPYAREPGGQVVHSGQALCRTTRPPGSLAYGRDDRL